MLSAPNIALWSPEERSSNYHQHVVYKNYSTYFDGKSTVPESFEFFANSHPYTNHNQLQTERSTPESAIGPLQQSYSVHDNRFMPSEFSAIEPEKRKFGSNKKERRRTLSINTAFANLRNCIPNVPCDTKLSKIKTLRLATSYIEYLRNQLNTDNTSEFRAEIHKKINKKTEHRRNELEAELNNVSGSVEPTTSEGSDCLNNFCYSGKGVRTGWPLQQEWKLKLMK